MLQKFGFWKYFSKAKTEECDQNHWSVDNKFGIIITCESTYFLEVSAYVSLEVATRVFLEVKKELN